MSTCFISSNGLKITVEQAKCLQANAFIQASLFQQFTFTANSPAVFRMNLSALTVRITNTLSFKRRLINPLTELKHIC